MTPQAWPLTVLILVLVGSGAVLLTAGVRFTRIVDELADRTGIGEALAGAVLLGATTSLPGLVTSISGAAAGDAGFAISNALGGIAAQTTFLAIADLAYRRVNLEHAAASVPNIVQTMTLISMIGVVLVATGSPDITVFGIHPATVILLIVYGYGLVLARRANAEPMWLPLSTEQTVQDEPEDEPSDESTPRLWLEFGVLALVVAVVGWVIAQSGLALAEETGLSGSLVGGLFTSVITSLPELVTVLAAVRLGAVTLAVADIIGGNTFDVLFVAGADVAYRDGSVYHAADQSAIFVTSLTVLLTATLAAGMLGRERRHIGFEGVGILVFYALGVASLVALG
ncbi:sodium:calcium antiporter [Mycobacterium sp. WMMD1722]|uniref:sodium:calcium antiporter n=1 Tax=Mycobacterium sp. WMMD1722 TaxID=3404117 RepID=UPI003BF48960